MKAMKQMDKKDQRVDSYVDQCDQLVRLALAMFRKCKTVDKDKDRVMSFWKCKTVDKDNDRGMSELSEEGQKMIELVLNRIVLPPGQDAGREDVEVLQIKHLPYEGIYEHRTYQRTGQVIDIKKVVTTQGEVFQWSGCREAREALVV